MNRVQPDFTGLFQAFNQVVGFQFGLALDNNGTFIPTSESKNFDRNKFSIFIKEVLKLTQKIIREGRTGLHESILIEGPSWKIFIMTAPVLKYNVAIIGNENLNTELIKSMFTELVDTLKSESLSSKRSR